MWIKKYSRPGDIQYDELVRGPAMLQNPYFPHVIKSLIIIPVGQGFIDGYYQEHEWDQLMRKIARRILRGKDFYSKHLRFYKKVSKDYLDSSLVFKEKNLTQLSDEKLLKYYQNFVQAIKNFWLIFYAPWAINEIIEPAFKNTIEKKFGAQASFILEAVANPVKEIRYNQQLKILLELKMKNRLTRDRLEKHAEKWGYLKLYAPQDSPFSPFDFLGMVQGLNPRLELRKMKESLINNQKNFIRVLGLLKEDQKLSNMAKLINYYVYLRTERIDLYREITMRVKPFYQELDRRLGLKNFESSFLKVAEIIDFLKHGIRPNLDEIRERARINYCWYAKKGVVKLILDQKKIKEIINRELKFKKIKKQFFGTVAQGGGIIKGRVKIILTLSDGKKFKSGEILIASMTRPEHTGIMKKAKAIITDEGGITCHAAIISRELGIPCVIGTKIATKVLKDNDLVEVDAEKGIVRKL